MTDHEPECPAYSQVYPKPTCECFWIRKAYQRGYTAGYNAHAASVAHWEATHGAYQQQHGQGENP